VPYQIFVIMFRTFVGVSIQTFPHAIFLSGMAVGLISFVVITFLIYYCANLVLKTCDSLKGEGRVTLKELGDLTLGKAGG